jgi:hypothetical protein
METTKSIEIIESMLNESKKSLHRNSFYFLNWGFLLIIAGIAEYFLFGHKYFWLIWPVMGGTGGLVSFIYGMNESKRNGVSTAGDRITSFTWGALIFTIILGVFYAVYNHLSPHPIVLMLAGSATFISGGISKFKPFIWGGIVLEIGAILCAFVFKAPDHGLVFAASIFLGYVIPGLMLRKLENDKA